MITTTRFARAGHSLIELITGMVAASMLLAGLASTMYIGRQIAYVPTASQRTIDNANTLFEMNEELQYALYIVEHSSTMITFVVDDRTGDQVEDTIRYEWSGTAGEPLVRTFNHGTPKTVIEDVTSFALSYDVEPTMETVATWNESAEAVLWTQTIDSDDEFELVENAWIGQYIPPLAESHSTPEDTVDWKLTKVQFEASEGDSGSGQFAVQLRAAGSDGTPMSEVLGEVLFNASDWNGSETWQTATFPTPIAGLSPYDAFAIIYPWRSGTPAAEFYNDESDGSGLLRTDDSGATWDCNQTGGMSCVVWGTYRTPGTPISFTRHRLVRMGIALQSGDQTIGLVETSARLVNRPELLSAYWCADFNADPTAQDINGDGNPDWIVRGGGTFDTNTLVGGVWQADTTLDTSPLDTFDKITTIDVRMRATSVGGHGAVFWINADWSDSLHAPIFTELQLQSNGIQTMTLYGKTDNATKIRLHTIPDLPDRFIAIRLVILPASNLVHLEIDDIDYGSFEYPIFSPDANDRFASILPWDSSAEFDSISVRVSE